MRTEGMSPLRRRMIEDMTVRNLSPTTRASYIHNVKGLACISIDAPDRLVLEDIRALRAHLVSRGVADSFDKRVLRHKRSTNEVQRPWFRAASARENAWRYAASMVAVSTSASAYECSVHPCGCRERRPATVRGRIDMATPFTLP